MRKYCFHSTYIHDYKNSDFCKSGETWLEPHGTQVTSLSRKSTFSEIIIRGKKAVLIL